MGRQTQSTFQLSADDGASNEVAAKSDSEHKRTLEGCAQNLETVLKETREEANTETELVSQRSMFDDDMLNCPVYYSFCWMI